MKKINLKNVKESLSREEMRTVSGGSGTIGCNYNSNCSSGCATTDNSGRVRCDSCCVA